MSWQQYVDQNLMCAVDHEGNTLSAAALVGFNDRGVWAHSSAFPADFVEVRVCNSELLIATCQLGSVVLRSPPSVRLQKPGIEKDGVPQKKQLDEINDYFNGERLGSFMIGDVKYMVIMSPEPTKILRGKCMGGGVEVYKTVQALVIGIWAEPITAQACTKVVQTLGEYLESINY